MARLFLVNIINLTFYSTILFYYYFYLRDYLNNNWIADKDYESEHNNNKCDFQEIIFDKKYNRNKLLLLFL